MKDSIRICILGVFASICICMPISFDTLAYRIHQREQTVSRVLAVSPGGGRKDSASSFVGNLFGFKKRKKFDLAFHRRLEQHFPDWEQRMEYQKEQEEFYKSVWSSSNCRSKTSWSKI